MSRRRLSPGRRWVHSLHLWHRYVGAAAAIVVAVVAVTGVLLNHTEELGLDERRLHAAWLLDRYGIAQAGAATGLQVGGQTLTLVAGRLYVGDRPVDGRYRVLLGAVASRGMLVVATEAGVLLLTHDATVVDRMRGPPGLSSVGLSHDGTVVASAGDALYGADRDLLEWRPWRGGQAKIDWSEPRAVAADAAGLAGERSPARPGLKVERVVLDLHSGRILGALGPYLYDAAALALLGLAASGLWLWIGRRRKRRARARAAGRADPARR